LFEVTKSKTQSEWVEGLSAVNVPCGPVNNLAQVFEDPQVIARGMKIDMALPDAKGGKVSLVNNPIRFSRTQVRLDGPPPHLGQHSEQVLSELLNLSPEALAALRGKGVV
jgi:formyl-CoA transferase